MRVNNGVPTPEKIHSIFEPHTDLIKRGKVRSPVEFGHKVFLTESAGGLITQYEVLKGNPVDEVHVAPSIRRHRRVFRRAPALYGADSGAVRIEGIADGIKLCHGEAKALMLASTRGTDADPKNISFRYCIRFCRRASL
jgi:hypothetical protein